jgi:4-hydroxy-tetrahydrodipicolinate reductase
VDIDPGKIGKDLGRVAGFPQPLGIAITGDPKEALAEKPDLVVHSTTSSLAQATPQILTCLEAGVDVISTCEELSFPYLYPELAQELDRAAKEHGVSVVGTGVNPGFVMDLLPVARTGACWTVEGVLVERRLDANLRRQPFQRKIGVGLSPEEFKQRVNAGGGHVGLSQSLHLLARGLGVEIDQLEQGIMPVVAEKPFQGRSIHVQQGQVLGLRQWAIGYSGDCRVIELRFEAFLGLKDPGDRVVITGEPGLELIIPEGIPGDSATAAVVVNPISNVLAAPAGLVTMLELPVPKARWG